MPIKWTFGYKLLFDSLSSNKSILSICTYVYYMYAQVYYSDYAHSLDKIIKQTFVFTQLSLNWNALTSLPNRFLINLPAQYANEINMSF